MPALNEILNQHMKRILGYSFLILAFISYKLNSTISLIIPNPIILIALPIILGILAIYFFFSSYTQKQTAGDELHQERIGKLKSTGEKIVLSSSNCEIKENNYYQEIVDNSTSRIAIADALYDGNRNVTQRYVKQTAIIYYYQTPDKPLRLTSQTFSLDAEELKRYLDRGLIVLYVDRFDKNNYLFDLLS
jgi:hypothetical protein